MKNYTLPWHDVIWSKLTKDVNKLPHAILFSGQTGVGKKRLAERFAIFLLCESPVENEACGICKSCKLIAAGNHPDYIFITPEEKKKIISVDQTREVSRQLQLKSHIAGKKVAIIYPAESMNVNAANSLLKILEEPPLDNIIILVTSKISHLPMTIKSRCIKISVNLPNHDLAASWLQAQESNVDIVNAASLLKCAGGAPLLAQSLLAKDFSQTRMQLLDDVSGIARQQSDFSACAKRWKETGADLCLMWFQGFMADLIKITMANTAKTSNILPGLTNIELSSDLKLPKKTLNLRQLFEFSDVLSESRKLLNAPMDELLLLEDILVRWQGLMKA